MEEEMKLSAGEQKAPGNEVALLRDINREQNEEMKSSL